MVESCDCDGISPSGIIIGERAPGNGTSPGSPPLPLVVRERPTATDAAAPSTAPPKPDNDDEDPRLVLLLRVFFVPDFLAGGSVLPAPSPVPIVPISLTLRFSA